MEGKVTRITNKCGGVVYDTLSAIEANTGNPAIDYNSLYVEDFVSLTERESFWKRLKGTRGRNLDTLAYTYR